MIAAAAPVPVAGAAVVADPPAEPAPAAQPTPARQTFAREVAGTPRQTVALSAQSLPRLQPVAGTTASAAEVFGAAIHAASAGEERDAQPVAPTPVAAQAVEVRSTAATPTQAPLDMRQNDWPATMIDRIERLRDAANAQDTRIRLVPDALGALDVSVKTIGGALHVRFASDNAETRALIEGASARLSAIAEDRGIRIGQTTVEAATAAASQQQAGTSSQSSSQGQGQNQSQSPSTQSNTGNQQQTAGQAQSGQPQSGQQQPRQQTSTARQPDRAARTTNPEQDAADDGRLA
nr:flagellar hook-length control protein FliK [Sphingomonas melonis]